MGVCAAVAQTSGGVGGRPARVFYLNRKQAIFITAKSETAIATEITIEIIHKFEAYETGARQPDNSAVLFYKPASAARTALPLPDKACAA